MLLNRQNRPQPLPLPHYTLPLSPPPHPPNSCKQRGICSVYSPQWAVHERVSAWMDWLGLPESDGSFVDRLFLFRWHGSSWVRRASSHIVKKKICFFPSRLECACAGVALFHRFISSFFSFFSPTLTFSHMWHGCLFRSLRSQVHSSKLDQLVTCVGLGLSDALQSLGVPPADSKWRKLKLRQFKLELSEFLLSSLSGNQIRFLWFNS